MSEPFDGRHIHGPIEVVIRKILDAMERGEMTQEQATALMLGLNHTTTYHRHDVSTPFRVALIAQGYEHIALKLGEVHMTLTDAGAMFEYGVKPSDDPDWLDHLGEEGSQAMLQASVWVLRGGNINASIAEDGVQINIAGPIVFDHEVAPDDVEALVNEFVQELDQEFPDKPPPRKGSWW
jgi:hypothetical protein